MSAMRVVHVHGCPQILRLGANITESMLRQHIIRLIELKSGSLLILCFDSVCVKIKINLKKLIFFF